MHCFTYFIIYQYVFCSRQLTQYFSWGGSSIFTMYMLACISRFLKVLKWGIACFDIPGIELLLYLILQKWLN